MPNALDIDACYRRYAPMVFRRCHQLLRSEDESFDALQDTFVQLTRYQAALNGTAMASLLNRMATNVCLNRIRKESRLGKRSGEELLVGIACAEDLEAQTLARRILARLMGRERESTRVIAVLHYVDGMTFSEVAQETGMSVSGVRKRLSRLKATVSSEVSP